LRAFVTEKVEDSIDNNVVSSYQLPKASDKELPFDVDNPYAVWYNDMYKDKAKRVIPKEAEFTW
jgi:streptogramin lyase